MTSVVSNIPKLQANQKVKEWRRLYVASTALLTEKQQIDMLPAYGARNEAELLIAEMCAKKRQLLGPKVS